MQWISDAIMIQITCNGLKFIRDTFFFKTERCNQNHKAILINFTDN